MTHFVTDIILVDIVGYSLLSDGDQLVSVESVGGGLRYAIQHVCEIRSRALEDIVHGFVPTGDGAYIILDPSCVGFGVLLTVTLRTALFIELSQGLPYSAFRVAVHTGSVTEFQDITGRRNYVGNGMNDTARLLSPPPEVRQKVEKFAGDSNTFVASVAALESHESFFPSFEEPEFLNAIQFRTSDVFDFPDKHRKAHAMRAVEAWRQVIVPVPRAIDSKLGRAKGRA